MAIVGAFALAACGGGQSPTGVATRDQADSAGTANTAVDHYPEPRTTVPPKLGSVDASDILQTTRTFSNNTQRLEPPGGGPFNVVSRDQALHSTDPNGVPINLDAPKGLTPTIKLALYTDDVAADVNSNLQPVAQTYKDRLVWAVIYDNIPASEVQSSGGAAGSEEQTPPDVKYVSLTVVDAQTGTALVGLVEPE